MGQVLAFTRSSHVAMLDTPIAVLAAGCCRRRGLATADAIICATAESHGVELLTCDPQFEGLSDVIFFRKTKVR